MPRLRVQQDVGDIVAIRGQRERGSYDPYFNRVNFIHAVNPSKTTLPIARTKP
jgi:hypothetical protein